VHRNAFHGAGLPFQGIVGEQRPTPNHRPTGDVGIGLHDLLDLGGRVLWRLLVVVNVADGDARVFLRGVLHALNTLLQVRRVLVAGQNRNDTFAAHEFGQLVHHLFAAFHIVDGVGDETFAVRRVGVEGGDRNAVFDRRIDGVGQFVGVRATDGDTVGAGEDELFNGLGLFLGVLFIGRAPVDFDYHAVFLAEVAGGV